MEYFTFYYMVSHKLSGNFTSNYCEQITTFPFKRSADLLLP